MVLPALDKYLLRTFGHEILKLINIDSDRDSLRYRNIGSLEDDILDDGHHHHTDVTAGVFAQFSLTQVEENDLFAVNGSFNINGGLGAKEVGENAEIEQVHQLLVDSLSRNKQVIFVELVLEKLAMFLALDTCFQEVTVQAVHHKPLQIGERTFLFGYNFHAGLEHALHLEGYRLADPIEYLGKGISNNLALLLDVEFVIYINQIEGVDTGRGAWLAAINVHQP